MYLKQYLFLFLFLLSNALAGQQLNFSNFSFSEGLKSYNIQKTLQDKYGFIWVATQDGLYRYNGKSFDVLKKDNTDNTLSENFIFDICEGPNDSIFAAAFPAGIDAISIKTLKVKAVIGEATPINVMLPNQWVQKLLYSGKKLWIGGNDFIAILDRIGSPPLIIKDIPGINQRLDVSFLKEISSNLIAVGIRKYGLVLFNPATNKVVLKKPIIEITENIAEESINDIAVSGDTIYYCFDHSVFAGSIAKDTSKILTVYTNKQLQRLIINSIAIEKSSGIIWLGTDNGLGKIYTSSGKFEIITEDPEAQRALKDNFISNLFIDVNKNLWISSSKILQVASLSESPFRAFRGRGLAKMDHIYTIDSLNESEIITTGRNGLFITNINTGNTTLVPGSSGLGIVHHIQKISPDLYLVSTDNGLFSWDKKRMQLSQKTLREKYPEWGDHLGKLFNNSIQAGDNIYFASDEQEGLLKWDRKHKKITQYKHGTNTARGLPENHIHNLKFDNSGNLWLLFDKYIAQFDYQKDTVTKIFTYTKNGEGPIAGIFFDLFDDGKKLWFSTYGGGINSWDKEKNTWGAITEKNGLCNNSVYSILPEKDSIIWVSTNMGLSRVNYFSGTCQNYFVEDGLQDNSFDEKGYFKNGNKLYFGGVNGFTEINTALYNSVKKELPLYVFKFDYYLKGSRISQYNLDWDKIELPAGTDLITIHCCALNFPGSLRTNFYYRIADLGKNYLPVNETNKLDLIINRYGNYELEITYLTETGGLFQTPLKFIFYVKPEWYQTWWFKILIVISIILSGYSLYRIRLYQLKKEENIRNQLAGDLHDDLGSTLNSVKVYANLALMEKENNSHLQKIKDNTQEAISGVKDIIWVLDDKKDTPNHLLIRINQFAVPLCEAASISYMCQLDEHLDGYKLNKEEKRNLYMIIKESINNSVKYSGATSIQLIIKSKSGKPNISISDNGQGFNKDQIVSGYGLKNMERRSKEIGYYININASVDKGTEIYLEKK